MVGDCTAGTGIAAAFSGSGCADADSGAGSSAGTIPDEADSRPPRGLESTVRGAGAALGADDPPTAVFGASPGIGVPAIAAANSADALTDDADEPFDEADAADPLPLAARGSVPTFEIVIAMSPCARGAMRWRRARR